MPKLLIRFSKNKNILKFYIKTETGLDKEEI